MRSVAPFSRSLTSRSARSLARVVPLAMLMGTLAALGATPAQALSATGTYRCKDYNVSTTLAMQDAPATMYVNETASTTMTSKMVFPKGAERHLANQWRDFTIPAGQPLPGTTWPVRTTYVEGGASINGTFGATSPTLITSYPRENVKLLGDGFTWTEAAKPVQIKAPPTPGDVPVKFGTFTMNIPLGGTLFFNDVPLGVEQWTCAAPANGLTVATVRVRSKSHVSFNLSPSTVQQGERGSAQATVSVDGGTANGTVTFFDTEAPATALGTAAVTNGTSSAAPLSALQAGEYEIGARFTPSNPTYYDGSTAADPQPFTVKAPGDTSTSLTVDPLNILTTESATATAEVSSAQGTPVGSIVFSVDGADRPAVDLVAGKASTTLSGLAKGPHPVVATFVPSNPDRHRPSTSLTRTVNVTKLADASDTTITFTSNPAWTTDPVAATATVSIAGGAVAQGRINWTVVGTDAGSTVFDESTSDVDAGTATLDLSDLPQGHYDVTADFDPTSPAEQTVSSDTRVLEVKVPPATTTRMALELSKTAATTGDTVTATASVSPTSPRPQGSIIFTLNGVDQAPQSPANGAATLTMPDLAAGSYEVSARFVPDDTSIFTPSSAPTQTVTVTNAPAVVTTTALKIAPGTISEDEAATVTATVSASSGSPTGRIDFVVTAVAGGATPRTFSRTYDGGATLVLDDLAPGSWTVTGTFVPGPTVNFTSSTSVPVDLTVTSAPAAASTTTLSLSRTTALTTDPVTATASIATARGSAAGSVIFTFDATTFTVPVIDGTASTPLTGLPVGVTTVNARFAPADAARQLPSTATPRTVTVRPAPAGTTVTTLSLSRSTAPTNVDVVATAQVSSTGAEPGGEIEFRVDGVQVSRRPLAAGSASFTLTGLTVGKREVTAHFVPASGNTTLASNSAPQHLSVVPAPGPVPSTALLSLSSSALFVGEESTATVRVSTASGSPSGGVEFTFRGATTTVPLTSGQGTLVLQAGTTPGTYEVSARFISDDPKVADSAPSTDSLVVSPRRASPSSITLSLSSDRAMTTDEVVLKAVVQAPVDETPGTVRFDYGTFSKIATVDSDSGQASAIVSGLDMGDYTVTATYLPDRPDLISASTSDPAQLLVNGGSALNLTMSSESVAQGATVTATAAVTTVGGSDSGVVTLSVGGQALSAPVTSGGASFTLPTLAPGTYPVRADFAPTDPLVLGARSSKRLLNVQAGVGQVGPGAPTATPTPRTTRLGITTSSASLRFAQAAKVTATVPEGAAGVVQFTVGAFAQDVVVSGGVASLSLPRNLPVGAQMVNASFLPAQPMVFAPSRASVSLTVAKDRTRLRFGKRYFVKDKVFQVRGRVVGSAGSLGQGRVRFILKRGSQKVASTTQKADCNGFAAVRFPIKKAGSYRVQIRYLGSDTLLPAKATMTKKIG